MMTKVEQIIEQEKIDAINAAVSVALDTEQERIAQNLYNAGFSIEKISSCIGIPMNRLEEILAPVKA